ncbi:MAG: transposase [Candidatus Marinimicrobia bacterium]|nr:transposase [Candidatus Neomarinimicrobiota bacterium]
MLKRKYVLGCDVASQTFVCSLLKDPKNIVLQPKEFANNLSGFELCLRWLQQAKISLKDVLICMEHTGVYSESLCYFFYEQKVCVVIESGAKIKRSFKLTRHKTDEIDSISIAEYAIRYADHLQAWEPRKSAVEKMKSLVSSRELFIKQRTAMKNALGAYKRKVIKDELLQEHYEKHIILLNDTIDQLEVEMASLITENAYWIKKTNDIKSICGAKEMMAYNVFILSNAFSLEMNHKKLAAYLRICPYQYQSGTSIKKKAKSPKYGPKIMRKLLYLASRSISTHNETFRAYYLRKVAEGKPGKLIRNNIANKLLKLICAIVNSDKPFIPNYQSVNSALLK